MEPQIDIFWLIAAIVVALAVRGAWRRLRYRRIMQRRRRPANRPVAVLEYIAQPAIRL